MGGWVPLGPPTGSGADSGTVYRGGVLADLPVDAESTTGTAGAGSSRGSLGLFGGLAAAAALSLTGFVVAGHVGQPDRVVGTMGDPAPLLPAPPALPPFGAAPSGAVDRPGKVSDLVGSAAVAPTSSVGVAPGGQPSGTAPVPATPAVPMAPGSILTPTPRPGGPAPGGPGQGGPGQGGPGQGGPGQGGPGQGGPGQGGPGQGGPGQGGPGQGGPGQGGPGEGGPIDPGSGGVTVALTVGSTVSLETLTKPGHLVRHDSSRAVVDRVGLGSSTAERAAARFTVRTGLADSRCMSFEAEDRRRYFLRHKDFSVYLHRRDRSQLFARDATFCPVPGAAADHVLLRSLNYPDRYLTVRGSLLFLDPAGSPESATFVVRPPV